MGYLFTLLFILCVDGAVTDTLLASAENLKKHTSGHDVRFEIYSFEC